MFPSTTDVLITGASPAGLVLALWLTRLGVRVRLVDTNATPEASLGSVVIHARTLEFYRQLGIAGDVLTAARSVHELASSTDGRAAFDESGVGLTPYPHAVRLPEAEHKRLLFEELRRRGGCVERGTGLVSLSEAADHVVAELQTPRGQESVTAAYLVKCDRGHSAVREGRVFLLSDAVAGQAMNLGIGDAVNLGWKLAVAIQTPDSERLLETYGPERGAAADQLVAVSKRLGRFSALPLLGPVLLRGKALRKAEFQAASQIGIEYRKSPLSQGMTGTLHAGDRLPWVLYDTTDNFAPLQSLGWQVHAYGEVCPDTMRLGKQRNLPVHVFPWRDDMASTGLQQDANYLVRPDGYVAFADPIHRAKLLAAYLDEHQITLEV